MIELDERICYSPHPPEAYSRKGVGHGLWCENRLKEWNLLWLSFPDVDGWLNPNAKVFDLIDRINPTHWGSVASIGVGTWDEVFPGLSAALRKPPREFLHLLLGGPYQRLGPYHMMGSSWIDTVRARIEESQPTLDKVTSTKGNTIYGNFSRKVTTDSLHSDDSTFAYSADAQFKLGKQYHDGDGVKRDFVKAAEYYLKAAILGHAKAQNNLGEMYANGFGVPQDKHKATEWFMKAAEQGLDIAQYNIASYFLRKDGVVPFDAEQAAMWYQKAAEQGNSDAQCSLGNMFEEGIGVPQDDQQAQEFYLQAALQDDETAQSWLWRRARLESAEQLERSSPRTTSTTGTVSAFTLTTNSALAIVRAAVELIRQNPTSYSTELEELQALAPADALTLPAAEMACELLTFEIPRIEQTLPQVLAWLATQDRVSVATLRSHLLPLDLLPGAVIDEINDRALAATGDPALEEANDEILVAQAILAEVLSNWDKTIDLTEQVE